MATADSKGSLKGSKEDTTVESDTKYSVLYESGLEAIDQDNAPEVVPGSDLNRKSSLLKPEAYHVAPYYSDKPEHPSYYEAPQALRSESEGMQAMSMDSKEAMMGEQEVNGRQEQRKQRRCCGIRRKIFIAIVVAVAVIVCIGIILGAVLGTVLPKKYANERHRSNESAADSLQMGKERTFRNIFRDWSGIYWPRIYSFWRRQRQTVNILPRP